MDFPGAKFAYCHINLLACYGSVKSWSMIIRLKLQSRHLGINVPTIGDVYPLAAISHDFVVAAEAILLFTGGALPC